MQKVSLIVALVVSVLAGAFLVSEYYQVSRDVESVAHRAQVAADASDMLEYTQELRAGMERHEMTHGHTALIFKTPQNDLAKLNDSLTQIIARLEAIKDIPRTATAYQVALDDIRGTIRELEAPTGGYIWVQYWFLIILAIGIWLWPTVVFFRENW